MSWDTVSWHHTGGTWYSKEKCIPYWERWSKTHILGYDEDERVDQFGEAKTLCGVTVPYPQYTYESPHGYKPSRLYPMCGSCASYAKARGLDLDAILADKQERK